MSGNAYLLMRMADRLRERLAGAEATHGMGHEKHTGYITGLLHSIRELEAGAEAERARARQAALEARDPAPSPEKGEE